MSRPPRPLVILHFSCDPTVLTDHGIFLRNLLRDLGCRVIGSANGFETIQLSASGEVDAAVLEVEGNHADVSLIAQEIERLRPSMPIVLMHAAQTLEGFRDLADAFVPGEAGAGNRERRQLWLLKRF